MSERFESLAASVEQMGQRRMFKDEQLLFAERALSLRFPEASQGGLKPSQLPPGLSPGSGRGGRPLERSQ